MHRDNVTVLHTKVVSYNTVDASAAVIQIIICQHDKDGVLALLALYQHGVTSEELESLHGVVGEGDDGVVIVDGICHTVGTLLACLSTDGGAETTYINELGFFFFLRIAVEVSSSCGLRQNFALQWRDLVCFPSLPLSSQRQRRHYQSC